MNTAVKSIVFASVFSLSSFAAAVPFYNFVGGEQTGNGMSIRAGHPGHLEIVESGEYHFQRLVDDPAGRKGPFITAADGWYRLDGLPSPGIFMTDSNQTVHLNDGSGVSTESLVKTLDAGTEILVWAHSEFASVFNWNWIIGNEPSDPFTGVFAGTEWRITAMDDGGLLNQFYWNGSSNADPDWVFTISKVNTTNVPEPGTLVLMSLGLFILGVGPKRLNPEYIDPGST